jgi:hypothetical protein
MQNDIKGVRLIVENEAKLFIPDLFKPSLNPYRKTKVSE